MNTPDYDTMRKKFGAIFIQTEKPFYNPGDLVKGDIYLDIHTPFNCWNLVLIIQGTETNSFQTFHERPDQKA